MIEKYKRFLVPKEKYKEFGEPITEGEYRKYVENNFHFFNMDTFETSIGHEKNELLKVVKEPAPFSERVKSCEVLNDAIHRKVVEQVDELLKPVKDELIKQKMKDYKKFEAKFLDVKPKTSEESSTS